MSYDKKDAAKDTKSSVKEVGKAWHQARDDAASSGQLDERNNNKTNDSENGPILRDIFKSIFGKSDD